MGLVYPKYTCKWNTDVLGQLLRRWHPTIHGKPPSYVQSKVPGYAESILHTQWAMCWWEKYVSMGSSKSQDIFLQAPLKLSTLKVTAKLCTPERSLSKASGQLGIKWRLWSHSWNTVSCVNALSPCDGKWMLLRVNNQLNNPKGVGGVQ